MFLHRIALRNILSFGPDAQKLALAPLNVFIGPNGSLYENAVVGELQPVVESGVDQPFFPVSKVRVRTSDTGHVFRRHWAVVSDDRREIFSIVAEGYRLVSNLRAYELGRRAFTLVFGKDARAGLRLFHVTMPATRSWAHIDLTAEGLDFAPLGEDRWLPFLRVTNSYNRSRALAFAVGVCRWICTNGMIFGEQSLKLKVSHATDVNLERRLVEAFGHWCFDVPECRDKLEKLARLSVPQERFPAGDAGDLRCEAAGRTSAERRATGRLVAPGSPSVRFGRKVPQGTRRHRIRAGQRRVGVRRRHEDAPDEPGARRRASVSMRHLGRQGAQPLRPRAGFRPVVDFRPGSMNAVRRLLAMETTGT